MKVLSVDPSAVPLTLDTTNVVHDVCTTLKRFLRSLDEPLMTQDLHAHWVCAAVTPNLTDRLRHYDDNLQQLPKVNYATVKKLVSHLVK